VKLSIIVPTIRPHNLRELWASTAKAINGRYPWEMVAIGPKNLDFVDGAGLWRFIQDEGSPCHCQQRALLDCIGEYVTWAADDGIWLPGSLDRDWTDDAILCKYMEGKPNLHDARWEQMDRWLRLVVNIYSRGAVGLNPDMVSLDRFWTIGYHQGAAVKSMPPESWCLCLGIIKQSVLLDVGGWNEDYETTGQGTVDLGLRLQKAGYKFTVWQHIVQALGYEPKGDEGSVMKAAYEDDMAKYKSYWFFEDCAAKLPIRPDAMQPGQPWARRAK